jgi:hypothetical protein
MKDISHDIPVKAAETEGVTEVVPNKNRRYEREKPWYINILAQLLGTPMTLTSGM